MRLTKWDVFWGLLVLWPAILWLAGFGVAMLIGMSGCEVSAEGPSPCIVLGVDVGETIYPLRALGYLAVFALLWVMPMGLVWWIAEIVRARGATKSHRRPRA